MPRTKNFANVIRAKLASDDDLAEMVDDEAFNADVAIKIFEARKTAKLTQKQLADRTGTRQSVISRIEDADYSGRSLALLKRIARALGLKLRVDFYGPTALPAETRIEIVAPNSTVSKVINTSDRPQYFTTQLV
jgi:transcriptional regulator with XRE-family HTH domain